MGLGLGLGLGLVQGQGWAGVSLLLRSRCTFACEHLNCASKHTSRAALRSTGPGPPPSRLSSSEQPRAELVAVGWNVPCAKWYAARWNAWNASIDAVVDGVLCGDQEGGAERGAPHGDEGRGRRPPRQAVDTAPIIVVRCLIYRHSAPAVTPFSGTRPIKPRVLPDQRVLSN